MSIIFRIASHFFFVFILELTHRALTSGTGVALALLLGAAGPLIGVAISASLLPPVVNCVSSKAFSIVFHQRNVAVYAEIMQLFMEFYVPM